MYYTSNSFYLGIPEGQIQSHGGRRALPCSLGAVFPQQSCNDLKLCPHAPPQGGVGTRRVRAGLLSADGLAIEMQAAVRQANGLRDGACAHIMSIAGSLRCALACR